MARKIKFPIPGDDIPAWFMTYSDVITLLMTFFILLLTFATTEPERFEKSVSSTFSAGAATGTVGKKLDGINQDSWINRLRPPAARIAMRGAEMPPIEVDTAKRTFGEGLRSLDEEEEQQNALTSHTFDVPLVQLFNSKGQLTPRGRLICGMLSNQLHELPFHASIQFSDPKHAENLSGMLAYLFDTEKTRPGQVAMSWVRNTGIETDTVRILIKRYAGNPQ